MWPGGRGGANRGRARSLGVRSALSFPPRRVREGPSTPLKRGGAGGVRCVWARTSIEAESEKTMPQRKTPTTPAMYELRFQSAGLDHQPPEGDHTWCGYGGCAPPPPRAGGDAWNERVATRASPARTSDILTLSTQDVQAPAPTPQL